MLEIQHMWFPFGCTDFDSIYIKSWRNAGARLKLHLPKDARESRGATQKSTHGMIHFFLRRFFMCLNMHVGREVRLLWFFSTFSILHSAWIVLTKIKSVKNIKFHFGEKWCSRLFWEEREIPFYTKLEDFIVKGKSEQEATRTVFFLCF